MALKALNLKMSTTRLIDDKIDIVALS